MAYRMLSMHLIKTQHTTRFVVFFLFITKYKMYELFKLTKHMKDKDNQYNWKKQDKFNSFGIKILIFTF